MSARPPRWEAHILVVDDDDRIRTLLKRFLSEHGYRVTAAPDAARARALLEALDFDLLILDVMMPGEDGLELTQSLRAVSEVPILLLTARGLAEDRIEGLRRGADDYVPKPFEPEELVLRIDAILRRAPPRTPPREVAFGPCVFDLAQTELRRDGAPVRLTTAEAALLAALAARPGEVISRAELSKTSGAAQERSVDVQVTRLRRKIEDDPRQPIFLQTVRGAGYKLAVSGGVREE
ncbi:MAG: response regulator [Caulobacterales bacterium]|nr:response regulator [Caulobacterales bacterium]